MRSCPTRSTRSSTTAPLSVRRRLATLVAALAIVLPFAPARAALDIDPALLYKQMKAAYDKGAAAGWHLGDELG